MGEGGGVTNCQAFWACGVSSTAEDSPAWQSGSWGSWGCRGNHGAQASFYRAQHCQQGQYEPMGAPTGANEADEDQSGSGKCCGVPYWLPAAGANHFAQ